MAIQNANLNTMKNYLNNSYYVPANQRDYSWEKDQLEDFWEDLCSVVENKDRTHFFGQIVIYIDKQKKYIIDGQQRTITSMIFLRAIQYVCEELLQSDDVEEKQEKPLHTIISTITDNVLGRPADEYIPDQLLHLTFESEEDENEYFSINIIAGAPTKKKLRKNKACDNMRNAYALFYDKITQRLQNLNLDDKIRKIYELKERFLTKFQAMYLETNDLGEAYIIFETLNARGKKLETADLLKNYIFSRAADYGKEVQSKWQKMTEALSEKDVTRYIRYFWNSQHKLVSRRQFGRI